ncbi:MAG: MAPEG family protein [Hyphomicrobium sp.]|nr:MAPEG family protein [Hyphomicrobium sp.]
MIQTAIFWPVAVLAFWTFAILLLVPLVRIRAVIARRLGPKDFRYGESERVPGDVAIPNRDYMNLLELPVLFYAIAIILYVTSRVDPIFVGLAWAFTGLRITHSLVHLSYNNVLHRIIVFAAATLVLLVIWVRFAWDLAAAG